MPFVANMKRPSRVSACAIVWADKKRLRPFYRAGKLLPFLAQAPHRAVEAAARAVVTGEVLLAGDLDLDPPAGVGAARRSKAKRSAGRGLWSALARINIRRLKGDRVIIIDASACFVSPATLGVLIQKLAKADAVGIAGNGAAVAMTRKVFTWLRRSGLARSVADLTGLFHLLQAVRKPERLVLAALPAVGACEQPLRDMASVYTSARAQKTAAALRLVNAGLGLRDPERIELRGTLSFGRDVFVDVNAIIMGNVILEDGVTVGPNCILEDVRIKAGSTIKEFSILSGAQVGPGCRIGPFARIRPGTRLGRGCQIGNFVEIKNATFGLNCKINHHSFVGDAVLGNDVIIGAGSMTCNYDGTKSNVTRIRNRAFIGSGVMLVAPVTVERHAFVGAGTTLVSDAPAHSLTLGRAKQISIKGWTKK